MNLPDPTEVMRAADDFAIETWAMVLDPDKKDAARARLESAVRTYGAACAAGVPLTAQQLDRLIEAHVGGAELADGEYSAMVMFAAAVERAHGIGAGGSQG